MAAQKSYTANVQAGIEKEIAALEATVGRDTDATGSASGAVFRQDTAKPASPQRSSDGGTRSGGRRGAPATTVRESRRRYSEPKKPPEITKSPEVKVLQARMKRLKQLDTWMKEDPDLLKSVDELISQQVKAAQRRQAMLSACIAVISLAGGWLLSAVPVPVIAHAFGR